MTKTLQNSYKFSLKSSLYITLFSLAVLSPLLYFFNNEINIGLLALFAVLVCAISFFTLQYRVEQFIYKRVKKIYKDFSLLSSTDFSSHPVTTDMKALTEELEKFTSDKKLEVETLKIQEEYRKEFMGNVSHELKTPLFTVQGYILTLLDGAMDDKTLRKKYLQRAEKGVERLIYIVKDLDMITRLEMGDIILEYETFDIIELIQSVFDLYEMKAAKKNITLTFDMMYTEAILVSAEKEKIQQVLSNLIVNSIKYGKSGGTTEISVENLTRERILVRVTDNGEGIAQENIARLFERFFRVDKSGSRKEGGSGLGLSIVKHIVEAHNEKIYVDSQQGIGSEFSFTLQKGEIAPENQ